MKNARPAVAITTCNLPSRGGVFNHIVHLARKLDRRKYCVYIVYYSPDPTLDLAREIGSDTGVTVLNSPALWSKRILFLPALAYLTHFYRSTRIALVYSIFAYTDLVATIAARLAGVPLIVSSIRGRLVSEDNPAWERTIYRILYPITARGIDRFIAVSEASKAEACQIFGLSPHKISVVPNGLDLQEFDAIRCEEEEPITVSVVGRLQYEKGVDVFVRSIPLILTQYPHVQFAVIGDGPDRSSLQNLVYQLGVANRVRFWGWREDARDLVGKHSVVVLPSCREGMPWTVLEAMALRKPIVASNVGGVPEIVLDGQTGLLVPPGQPPLLADAIIRLLRDPELRAEMGYAGRQRVERYFTVENTVAHLERIFDELLRKYPDTRAQIRSVGR